MLRKGILVVATAIVVLALALQLMAKAIITDFLDRNLPDYVHLDYNVLKANVFTGSVGLEGVRLEWAGPDTTGAQGVIIMDALNLEGLGYFGFVFHNSLNLDHVEFVKPKMSYAPYRRSSKKDRIKNGRTGLERELAIARLNIVEGEYRQLQEGPDSIKLLVENLDISVMDLRINAGPIKNGIPFTYGDYVLGTGKVRLDLGSFEILEFKNVGISQGNMMLNGLSLTSKYSKRELSRLLKHERDHIDLKIPEISLMGLDFGSDGDRFFLNVESGTVDRPYLEMYRDKLVADDMKRKNLYGRMLREMPFDMDIAWLNIKRGHIAYTEQVAEDAVPGEISFTEVEASLKAISNIRREGEGISIEIRAKLMGAAPLLLKWDFDSNKQNDAFLVSGRVSDFKAASVNPFLKSNLRAEAKGDVEELYFTIGGDAITAKGDMKMRYMDFSFAVLQKDRVGVNKLLTAIGNIFVNDGSKTDEEGYRHGDIYAERDTTKSFFNYLWLSVKSGIVSTLTGDGKE